MTLKSPSVKPIIDPPKQYRCGVLNCGYQSHRLPEMWRHLGYEKPFVQRHSDLSSADRYCIEISSGAIVLHPSVENSSHPSQSAAVEYFIKTREERNSLKVFYFEKTLQYERCRVAVEKEREDLLQKRAALNERISFIENILCKDDTEERSISPPLKKSNREDL
ncbi:hypothetical protein P9112_011607 [Eukaryota sp. TZLM1-RC]